MDMSLLSIAPKFRISSLSFSYSAWICARKSNKAFFYRRDVIFYKRDVTFNIRTYRNHFMCSFLKFFCFNLLMFRCFIFSLFILISTLQFFKVILCINHITSKLFMLGFQIFMATYINKLVYSITFTVEKPNILFYFRNQFFSGLRYWEQMSYKINK